jgi:hypothetical protein
MTFEEFAAARLPALLRYAVMLTGDRELAQDVVQEVMIRAHGRWWRIRRADRPDLYVRRMVTNEFISTRLRRALRTVPLEHLTAGPVPTFKSYLDATLLPGWLPDGSVARSNGENIEPKSHKSRGYHVGTSSDDVTLQIAGTEEHAYFDNGPQNRSIVSGERVEVNGHAGTYRRDEWDNGLILHLTWQPSPGLWASVNYWVSGNTVDGVHVDFDPAKVRADVLRIARSAQLKPAGALPGYGARFPITVGYLPPGVRKKGDLLDLSTGQFNASFWTLFVSLDRSKPSGWDGSGPTGPQDSAITRVQVQNQLRIETSHNGMTGGHPKPDLANSVKVNGRTAVWEKSGVGLTILAGPGGLPMIEVWGDLPKAELLKVAQGIRLVPDPNRHENWTDKPLG